MPACALHPHPRPRAGSAPDSADTCSAAVSRVLPPQRGVAMPVVMDADRMGRTLTRIAHEIVERNRGLDELALVGIRTRGVPLARRLAARAAARSPAHDVPTGALDITLYRDDLMRNPVGPQPVVRSTEIPFSIDDRVILLVDDVLYTGPDGARRARRADRLRPAAGHPARRAGRPRPPRAADQGRLRRQEPADVAQRERRRCGCWRSTACDEVVIEKSRREPHEPETTTRLPADDRRRAEPAALRGKDLLGIAELSAEEITLILDTAERDEGDRARGRSRRCPTLRGKTVVNLFFEPSTRTRTSFEIAEKRLSADTLNIAGAHVERRQGRDARRHGAQHRGDVARHDRHAPLLVRRLPPPVAHLPVGRSSTPATACTSTRRRRCSTPSRSASARGASPGLKVAIVGDLLHSRVLRSNVLLLTKMGADVWLCGPPTLVPPGFEQTRRARHVVGRRGRRGRRRRDDAAHPARADARRLLPVAARVLQRVRHDARARCALAKPDVIVMHPGPMNRGVEIASDVADGPYSVILDQVANGVAVRMAVLYLLAGGAEHEAAA